VKEVAFVVMMEYTLYKANAIPLKTFLDKRKADEFLVMKQQDDRQNHYYIEQVIMG